MNRIFLFAIVLFLFSACKSKVIIDNPTDYAITVSIGDEKYEIAAASFVEIELSKKVVNIIAKDTANNELINEMIAITGDGVINPTKSTYIIWTDLYCKPEDYEAFKDKLDIKEVVIVNDKEYEAVDFEIKETVFIAKDWDLNLNESFPDSVDISNDFVIKSKLYNVPQLEAEFGYFGNMDFTDYNESEVNAFMDSLKAIFGEDSLQIEMEENK